MMRNMRVRGRDEEYESKRGGVMRNESRREGQ